MLLPCVTARAPSSGCLACLPVRAHRSTELDIFYVWYRSCMAAFSHSYVRAARFAWSAYACPGLQPAASCSASAEHKCEHLLFHGCCRVLCGGPATIGSSPGLCRNDSSACQCNLLLLSARPAARLIQAPYTLPVRTTSPDVCHRSPAKHLLHSYEALQTPDA